MKHLRDKLPVTTALIQSVMKEFRNPAVMWSSGKDSMVLLFIMRAMKLKLPVIFHREPFFAEKYQFANQVIQDWKLEVYDWPPARVAMQEARGVVETVSFYQVGPGESLALPKNLYEPATFQPGNYLCGLKDLLDRPTGSFRYPWDVIFHGHKSSDVDPLMGPVPLTTDVKRSKAAPSVAFPLRHWTDDDIWDYTEKYGVPQQWDRYHEGKERPDTRETNPDYWSVCTRCLNRCGPAEVHCPKLDAQVRNISKEVPYVEPSRPDYISKEEHHAV